MKVIHNVKSKQICLFWRAEFVIELPCSFLNGFSSDSGLYFAESTLSKRWGFDSNDYSGYRQSEPFYSYAMSKEGAEYLANKQIDQFLEQLRVFKNLFPYEEVPYSFTEI